MKRARPGKASPPHIVITGTPGTGKTVIAKSLAREVGADYLSLTKLVVDKHLHSAVDVHRHTKVVDLETTRECLRRSLSRARSLVIVDTHIPDAIPRRLVDKVIVLRCHPKVLQVRLRRRHWSKDKIRENVLAEILDSCYTIAVNYYGPRRIAQIDTSEGSLSKSVNQSKRILKKQISGRARVDWVAVLNRDQSLERYLG